MVNESLPKSEEAPRDVNLPATAFAFSLAAMLSASFGMGSSWPPNLQFGWVFTAVFSMWSILAGLFGARLAGSMFVRCVCAASILISLLADAIILRFVQESYHDYPWLLLGPLIIVMPFALAFCRLKMLSAGFTAFLVYWLYAAFLPPIGGELRTVKHGDLSLTVDTSQGWRLIATGPQGRDLSKVYDLENIKVNGQIGPIIPVQCWPPHAFDMDEKDSLSRKSMYVSVFPSKLSRSWDAKIWVPAWPKESQAQVVVDTTTKNSGPSDKGPGGFSLAVTGVWWTIEHEPNPEGPCLHLNIVCMDPRINGWNSKMLRITDDSGHVLHYDAGGWNGDSGEFEICPIDRKIKHVRVDLYSQADREQNQVEFDFPRLRTR